MAMFTTKKVDGFSHGFRLVDNQSDGNVTSQRNKENQAVKKRSSDFFCCRIIETAQWL